MPVRHPIALLVTVGALTLAACGPPPPPLPPGTRSHVDGVLGLVVTDKNTGQTCTAALVVEMSLDADVALDVYSHVEVYGNLPGCDYHFWSVSAWAVCGTIEPFCGNVDLGTLNLEQTHSRLLFTHSPQWNFIRIHFYGVMVGTTDRSGYDDSPIIECVGGRCGFHAPIPN